MNYHLACEGFSTKWLVIVVSMGFIMFLILAFDCILYGKKTGLSYKLLSCCRKKEPRAPDDKNARKLQNLILSWDLGMGFGNGIVTPLRLKLAISWGHRGMGRCAAPVFLRSVPTS